MEMEKLALLKPDMRVASIAGRILPMVGTIRPDRTFPAEIARRFPIAREEAWNFQNLVGAALRYLEKEGFVSSKRALHPDGHPSPVKLYELTQKGHFMVSLVS